MSDQTTKSVIILNTSLVPARNEISELIYSPVPLPTLRPSLPSTVQMGLTALYIVLFSLIFIWVYVQLWMIWYYRHKRIGYQTLFLFMCLIWAGLRISLFSFYFKNCFEANDLNAALYWILYSLPVCLQFSMLCVLLHYFSQVVLKARAKYEPQQYKLPLHLFIAVSVLVFMAVNIACAVVTRQHEVTFASVPLYLIYIRVALTETMFFIYGALLSIAIFKMTKMASTQRVLEAQGTTVCKAVVAAVLITLLFLSRTVYNLISVCPTMAGIPTFGFDWINVTDQADIIKKMSGSLAFVSFGIVLFVWEVLPISIVVTFFRVKRLNMGQVLTDFSAQINGSRVFFFDNHQHNGSESDSISHPAADNLNTTDSQSYSSNSIDPLTPCGTNVMTVNPQQRSSIANSNIHSNSSFLRNNRGSNYGSVGGEGFVHTRPNSAHGASC